MALAGFYIGRIQSFLHNSNSLSLGRQFPAHSTRLMPDTMDFGTWLHLATTVMLAVLSVFVWRYKQAVQRRAKKEDRLNDELFKLYDKVLEPYLLIMGNDQVWKANKKYRGKSKEEVAMGLIVKPDYQEAIFKLTLIAPHYVVSALNEFLTHSRKVEARNEEMPGQPEDSIRQLGKLLRAVRKGFGHDFTPVRDLDMVKWFIGDFDILFPRRSWWKLLRR